MRKINKQRKKLVVTRDDLFTEDEKNPLYNFNRMTYVPLYEYRIRKYLYEIGKLSPKGFLGNGDILSLPGIAKKDINGNIHLDEGINSFLTRFSLSQQMINSGNEFLGLLVDVDDALYEKMIKGGENESVFENDDIVKEVSKAEKRMSMALLDFEMLNYIQSKEELADLYL